MQVSKWGNSLAVRLPAAVVEALELKEGDEIQIRAIDYRELEVARKPSSKELLERLRRFRGRLPEDFVLDREQANAGNVYDTNVLLYLAFGDAVKAAAAERAVDLGGTISVQVLNEFVHVARGGGWLFPR